MLIDTHCHLDLPPLYPQLDELLQEARLAGIERWVVPSVHPGSWQRIARMAADYSELRPAYGIHPQYAAEATSEQLNRLDRLAPSGIAIGEVGLDATMGAFDLQEHLLRSQLRIARRHGLPVLIHCRRCIGRLMVILKEEGAAEVGGIMHAFSGSLESARECIRLGFVISLSCTLTWTTAEKPRRLARELPFEQLVLETDAPDLTPVSHRGQPNRPAWLSEVAHACAAIRDCSVDEVASCTTATARRVLPGL